MFKIKLILSSLLILALVLQIGCGKVEQESQAVTTEANSGTTPEMTPSEKPTEMPTEKPSEKPSQDRTGELLKQEETQISELPEYELNIFVEEVQKAITAVYKDGDNLDAIISKLDKEQKTKDTLIALQKAGYKIETGEGMFYPVVDYEVYRHYSTEVTPEIAAYFDIMAVESAEKSFNDAALAITWDELVKRVVNIEAFTILYPSSIRIDKIQALFKNYTNVVLYGINNTPLFDNESKLIRTEAQTAYENAVKQGNTSESKTLKLIADYLTVLDQNKGKLTAEVAAFQKEHEPK